MNNEKINKKILLLITGSIAAYKSVDLIRILKKRNYDVVCVLTKAAQKFITPLLCSSISGNKTYTKLFSADDEIEMGHIKLSRDCDLVVVAPASADFIAKLANGFGDDLASTIALASDKQIMVAPAMNQKMWENEQNQNNLKKISESKFRIIQPETDILACGEYGIGKMSDPLNIANEIDNYFKNKNLLEGKKILLTGGGTIEPIDPVRFIGNNSSGIQAIEIAKILNDMGADITLIAANIKHLIPLDSKKIINCMTAEQMLNHVKNHLSNNEVFISCAAIADFKVKNYSSQKIKKSNSKSLNIELVENVDILKFVGHNEKRPKLVIGFAAESCDIKENSLKKLHDKNCDFIIANDVANGNIFGNLESKSFFINHENYEEFGLITKKDLANKIAYKIIDFFKN